MRGIAMVSKRNQKIIVKYLINEASISELDELELWLKDSINEEEFINYVKTNYAIEYSLKEFDSDKTKSKINQLINEETRILRVKRIQRYSRYAAVLIIFLFTSVYFFKDIFFESKVDNDIVPGVVNSNNILPGTNKATLTLEDGTIVALEKGETIRTQNANSNGEKIIYNSKEDNPEEVAYNYLTIPRGGQFFIKLSDGTQVWLNSESQLKYPVNFIEGEPRKVELVYGEAYFDVSPSKEHKGAKFFVFNNNQEVEVIGTQFNIKAYKDETNIYTTLVEGKISVSTENIEQILMPDQQANLNINKNTLAVATVNVYNEISWKDGVFSFRRKPLVEIMKVLSRWYDIDVEFVYPELKKEGFNGVLGKDQNIEDILKTIKSFGVIQDYEIINKRIILK